MIEIIPAINAENWTIAKKQIDLVSACTEWIHLDVADGKFTPNITWNNAEDLKRDAPANISFEVHLMLIDPEEHLSPWIKAGVRRIILHWEKLKPQGIFSGSDKTKIKKLVNNLRENWVEFGLSVPYHVNTKEIERHIESVDMVHILAVEPGLAGQESRLIQTIEKIKAIKKLTKAMKPDVKIEVDGGVNSTNIKDFYLAGANVVAVSSAIFNTTEPRLALESLRKIILG